VRVLPDGLARAQPAAARQRGPGREIGIVGVDRHRHHGHRWRGRHEMRIDDVEQMPGEARVLGIELQGDARRQEGGGLDQPFDIGVGDLLALDAQPVRDLREGARELRRALAEVAQFLFVQGQQARVHLRQIRTPPGRPKAAGPPPRGVELHERSS
jgi:hypothetical protein